MIALDLVNTLALAGLVLFAGYAIRARLPFLARVNIPAPVIGGLLVAALVTGLRARGLTVVQLDTTLQAPLMIAFFTTVGFGASVSLLRVGGPAVLVLPRALHRRRRPAERRGSGGGDGSWGRTRSWASWPAR